MPGLVQLVEALYRLRGFDAAAEPTGSLLRFRRGDESVAVRLHAGAEPLSADAAMELASTLPALGHGVVVSMGTPGAKAREALERAGVEVWTRDKLVHEVGLAYVHAAEQGASLSSSPAPASLNPAPAGGATPADQEAPTPWLRGLRAASPAPEPLVAPAPPTPPEAAPPAEPGARSDPGPEAPSSPRERILSLAVDEAQATGIATARLMKVTKARLELVPRRVFRYQCTLAAKGRFQGERAGTVTVDAVHGTAEEVREAPAFGPLPGPAQRLQAIVTEEDAGVAAKRRIIEAHSQKVRQKSASNGAYLVQDVWVRPEPGSIALEPEGVWWTPVWHVEGHNGSVRVDATTGDLTGERLKRAFATDAEFL